MPNYRRYSIPGAAFFFTLVTDRRRPFLTDPEARRCLREAIRTVRNTRPFELPGVVLLPDHLHALWVLPPGDAAYDVRWRRIKERFTRTYLAQGGEEGQRSASRQRRAERGVWQRRYWEHTIADEDDFDRHLDYIHYNPVKHGLVACPRDWPYSSFHRWVRRGVYPTDWGCAALGPLRFDDLDQTAIE